MSIAKLPDRMLRFYDLIAASLYFVQAYCRLFGFTTVETQKATFKYNPAIPNQPSVQRAMRGMLGSDQFADH